MYIQSNDVFKNIVNTDLHTAGLKKKLKKKMHLFQHLKNRTLIQFINNYKMTKNICIYCIYTVYIYIKYMVLNFCFFFLFSALSILYSK